MHAETGMQGHGRKGKQRGKQSGGGKRYSQAIGAAHIVKMENVTVNSWTSVENVDGIPGLAVANVNPAVAHAALRELRPYFRNPSARSSSAMFEVGWSFHAMDKDGVMRPGMNLADFPALRAVLSEAMWAVSGSADLWEDTLNVICRRYSVGQGLPTHVDRPQMFDEDVYGCVLLNESDRCLEFERSDKWSGQVIETHRVNEVPGTCFRQRGPARYEYSHGIKNVTQGERISVTWRWIDEKLADEAHKRASCKGKGAAKGEGFRKSPDTRPSVDLTTLSSSPSSDTPVVLALQGAEVLYFPSFLMQDEAADLFAELNLHESWKKRPIMVRDRNTGERFEALEGRPTVSFSLPEGREYRYSGCLRRAEAFPQVVLDLKARIEKLIEQHLVPWASHTRLPPHFNYCLANKYENGSQAVGKHSDDEPDIVPRSPIACLSLGATRTFQFDAKDDPSSSLKIKLETGSVILMLGQTQELYLHSISKDRRVKEPRISLTFRVNVTSHETGKLSNRQARPVDRPFSNSKVDVHASRSKGRAEEITLLTAPSASSDIKKRWGRNR